MSLCLPEIVTVLRVKGIIKHTLTLWTANTEFQYRHTHTQTKKGQQKTKSLSIPQRALLILTVQYVNGYFSAYAAS